MGGECYVQDVLQKTRMTEGNGPDTRTYSCVHSLEEGAFEVKMWCASSKEAF